MFTHFMLKMFAGKNHDTVTPDVYQFAALAPAARRCLPPSWSLAKRSQFSIVSTTSASTARHVAGFQRTASAATEIPYRHADQNITYHPAGHETLAYTRSSKVLREVCDNNTYLGNLAYCQVMSLMCATEAEIWSTAIDERQSKWKIKQSTCSNESGRRGGVLSLWTSTPKIM